VKVLVGGREVEREGGGEDRERREREYGEGEVYGK
jgi:hypothetical protein